MMHDGWNDGGWWIVWMVLCWGLIIALVWAAIRFFGRGGDRQGSEHEPLRDPKEVLAQRFAKGEIDAEEYHERLRVLEETRPPHG